MNRLFPLLVALPVAALLPVSSPAQAPGVPIERGTPEGTDENILAKAAALREAGKLPLDIPAVKRLTEKPEPGVLSLAAPHTAPLSGREVARRAREATLKFGWYYLCTRCDHWHLKLAGAYAIAPDAIATCHHCVKAADDMREGFLIAVDHRGEVLPVTAVLAGDEETDGAILRVTGAELASLPLNDNVAPGDDVFCFSTPLGQTGYFSQGIVNRFFWRDGKAGGEGDWSRLRINVSADWAPGSSGAAVLDACGNAIGHVSTIRPMREGPQRPPSGEGNEAERRRSPDRFGGATLITLHDATPARAMMSMARPLVEFKPPAEVPAPVVPDSPPTEEKVAVPAAPEQSPN